MKFAEHLQQEIFPPWKLSYLSYETLKRDLKSRQLDHAWNQEDEISFKRMLENELSKVYDFITAKLSELESRINYCERTIQTFKHTAWSTEENWKLMEDALTEALFDVNDLSTFTRLNYIGFQKILKKHDKHTHLDLQQSFVSSLRRKPLDKQRLDLALVFISALHDLCKRRGQPRVAAGPFDDDHQEEEKTRYWVHPDNMTEVKSILMLHLPVLIQNPGQDASVSTVCLDSPDFSIYTGLLQRDPDASPVRLTTASHGTESTLSAGAFKIRLDHKDIGPFLAGTYRPQGSSEIQEIIKNLEPVCRIFYHRTTFGDVQVTMDSELTFIREDNFLRSKRRASGEWQRPVEYPYDSLPPSEILRFPYAILETTAENAPEWLVKLLSSHLVHEVPRFSKYLHGVSYLFRDQLPLLPWWLSEMEIDIRKPPTQFGLSRSKSFKPLLDGQYSRAIETEQLRLDLTSIEPVHKTMLDRNKSVNDWENRPHRMKSTLVSKGQDPLNYGPLKRTERKEGAPLGEDVVFTRGDIRLNMTRPFESANMYVKDPNNPNAVIPVKKVKVEPKVFFSNERTFISWLQFCALLLSVALNLLNFGDQVSRIAGALFIGIAAVVALYALYQFEKRAWMINRQIVGRYDDLWGPAVLCFLVVGALVVNFYLRFR
ncbi:unnamed protein product [Rhizopus stolonifer]